MTPPSTSATLVVASAVGSEAAAAKTATDEEGADGSDVKKPDA